MSDKNRILMFGRYQDILDRVTGLLEGVGFTVTSTLNDGVAIDTAGSSDFDALLIGDEVSQSDRRYVTVEARKRNPSMAIIVVRSPESVLTQVRQAGIQF